MGTSVFSILLLGIFVAGAVAGRKRLFVDPVAAVGAVDHDPIKYNGSWYTYTVPVDNFNYRNGATYKMRYFVNLDNYDPSKKTVFFYTGNEGKLESFIDNTGIIWDLAKQFGAAVVFAEHRYYGRSFPFGTEDASFKSAETMGYLTSEQALADYAKLIYYLKSSKQAGSTDPTFPVDSKWVAFGGSYGGMLAAWFRMKYPHLVVGAWASSAPLRYFNGAGVDWGVFDSITTRTFQESGCDTKNMNKGFTALLNLASTDAGRQYLTKTFNIDPKSPIRNGTDGYYLYDYVREAIEYMAMTDYPYDTNFLETMPAWPVKTACTTSNMTSGNFTDMELAAKLQTISSVYYGWQKNVTACINPDVCGDTGTDALGSPLGWPWQECTEIVVEMCARANSSMFFEECTPHEIDVLKNYCVPTFTKYNWSVDMMRENGVRDIYGLEMSAHSNIILTQGQLDPWSGGGFKTTDAGINGASGIYVWEIPGSAHHLDLRTPNTCDPEPVANARYQIVGILQCWLTDGCKNPAWRALPKLDVKNTVCKDWNNGYPWGQKGPAPDNKQNDKAGSSLSSLISVVALLIAKLLL